MTDRKARKEILRTLIQDVWNKKQVEKLAELFADDVTLHLPDRDLRGRDQIREEYISRFLIGFPDLKLTILDLFGEDDRFALRMQGQGTHTGDYFGKAATGKRLDYTGTVVFRMEGSRIAEMWPHSTAAAQIADF